MSTFHAWDLPPEFVLQEEELTLLETPSLPALIFPALTDDRLKDLLRCLRRAREESLSATPVARVVRAVDRVARRLLDPGDELRRFALEGLGPHAGFSSPMAEVVLEGMARDWVRDRTERLLQAEFRDPLVLDGFRQGAGAGKVRAMGYPLAFHLGAGTVPGVAVTSLVRSLLVKSAVVLKPGRGDVVLPVVFAKGLREEDAELAGAVAILYWPEGSEGVTEMALSSVDLVMAYGGNETLRWVHERTPFPTPVRAYPHRMGFALVGRGALDEAAVRTARAAARSVAMFDQRGCVSPQVFFVEEGGEVGVEEWAELLAGALEELQVSLPPGPVSPEEAADLHQLRGVGELNEGAGTGRVFHGGREALWTVLFQPGGIPEPTCLNRSVRVLPVTDLREALQALRPWRAYLQTVGVVGIGEGAGDLLEELAGLGVSRIVPVAQVPWPPPWWHHDGGGPLQAMVRWTDVEGDLS